MITQKLNNLKSYTSYDKILNLIAYIMRSSSIIYIYNFSGYKGKEIRSF